jgi:hypothetical protein
MRTLSCLVLLLASAGVARASTASAGGLADALAARSMLGADTWARVVRIESSRPGNILRRGPYPRIVYALVFELSGILWFYTDVDGTQSLSLTSNTADRDREDPGPLFRAIDPGFTRWTWVEAPRAPSGPAPRRPRNACFVESVAELNRRIASGAEAASPMLLSYYVDTPGGRLGHTVLLFRTSAGLSAIDADESDRPIPLPGELGADARALSAYLRGGPVAAARTIPIACPRRPPAEWAALPAVPAHAG